MKQAALKFLALVVSFTIICIALEMVWNNQTAPKWHIAASSAYTMLGIFAVSVTGIHLFLLNQAKGSGQSFIRGYMATTVFKFMAYLLILIVFLLFSTENKQSLILHFLFYYLVFTALEVTELYKATGKK